MKDHIKQKFLDYCKDLSVICTNGRTFHDLYLNIAIQYKKEKGLYQFSPTIFAFISGSLMESATSHLFRLYDTHHSALSIHALLAFISANHSTLFGKTAKVRKATETGEELKANCGDQLDKLKNWRDKRLFHVQKNYAGDLYKVYRENVLTVGDFMKLFNEAEKIINYYLSSAGYPTTYMKYLGVDLEFPAFINQLKAERADQLLAMTKPRSKCKRPI